MKKSFITFITLACFFSAGFGQKSETGKNLAAKDSLTRSTKIHHMIWIGPLTPLRGHVRAGYNLYFKNKKGLDLAGNYWFKAPDETSGKSTGFDVTFSHKWHFSKKAPSGFYYAVSFTFGSYSSTANYVYYNDFEDFFNPLSLTDFVSSSDLSDRLNLQCPGVLDIPILFSQQASTPTFTKEVNFISAGPGIALGYQRMVKHFSFEARTGIKTMFLPKEISEDQGSQELEILWGSKKWWSTSSPGSFIEMSLNVGYVF